VVICLCVCLLYLLVCPCIEITWTVEKRYNEFRMLRREICRIAPELRPLVFPRRKMLFNFSASNLKHRQDCLCNYLAQLVAHRPGSGTNGGSPHLQEICE
jgi:hypothetical protein